MIPSFSQSLSTLLRHSKASLLAALSCAFEWYDYALFGYFTTTLSVLFFSEQDPKLALLYSLGVFASGFLMRPVGAIVFGYIGDRIGRRRALTLSLVAMALPTILLGLLPTYKDIGIWATIALIGLRLLQGLAVGGNYGGSFIVTIERAPKNLRSLAGSIATFGTLGGLFLGSAAAFLANTCLDQDQLLSFGWRIPFLLGGMSILVAHWIKKYIPQDENIESTDSTRTPLKIILKDYKLIVTKAIGIILIDGVGIYLALVFMTTFATTFLNMPQSLVFMINTLAMAILVLGIPFFGFLSDTRFAPKQILSVVALGLLFVSLPLYLLLVQFSNVWVFALTQGIFALLIAAAYGTLPITVVSMFPKHIRYSATGLAFNISVACFGGTAPMIVTFLMQKTQMLWMPGLILSIVGIISYACVRTVFVNHLNEDNGTNT